MLAGSIVLSAATGVAVMLAMMALSMPLWLSMAAYPVTGGLTMLLCAALWNIRTGRSSKDGQLAELQPHA
jgi:hypothetical protein